MHYKNELALCQVECQIYAEMAHVWQKRLDTLLTCLASLGMLSRFLIIGRKFLPGFVRPRLAGMLALQRAEQVARIISASSPLHRQDAIIASENLRRLQTSDSRRRLSIVFSLHSSSPNVSQSDGWEACRQACGSLHCCHMCNIPDDNTGSSAPHLPAEAALSLVRSRPRGLHPHFPHHLSQSLSLS